MPKASRETASEKVELEGYEGQFEHWDGGYSVGFERYSADADLAPLFVGLPDDRCQCPHWGYVIRGKVVFAYADGLPEEWKAFRLERMTALMTRVRAAVKAARPRALVTVAAAPDIKDAFDHKLQNWPAWLDAGLVDAVAPMAYTPEPARFAQQIAAASGVAGGGAIWAGIGAYRLTPAQTIDNIQTARRLGTAGIVLFSYDSLIDPKQTPANYLAVVGRSAFTASSAPGSQ